jgi:hypothetical protein
MPWMGRFSICLRRQGAFALVLNLVLALALALALVLALVLVLVLVLMLMLMQRQFAVVGRPVCWAANTWADRLRALVARFLVADTAHTLAGA